MMINKQPEKGFELAEQKSPPVLTILLIVLVIYVSWQFNPQHGEVWLHNHVFQANQLLEHITLQRYADIAQVFFFSNFLAGNNWQLLFYMYFFFTFGIQVESRLGPSRYILLVLLSATIPWLVSMWDILHYPVWPIYFEHSKVDTYFYGPSYILCALVTAYHLIVPQKARRELYIVTSTKQQRTEYFNRKPPKPINELFGLPPELFISAFVIYEIVLRAVTILPWKDLDTVTLSGVISSMAIAWMLATIVMYGLKSSYDDNPLKLEAIRRYNELLDLDVDSANAIKGAARATGLPDEQVHTWVLETKGKLRTK